MNEQVIVIDAEPVLTRRAIIQFNGEETTELVTFGLIPENWVNRDLEQHPADDSIFYWLTAYEWIRFGSTFDGSSDFKVITA